MIHSTACIDGAHLVETRELKDSLLDFTEYTAGRPLARGGQAEVIIYEHNKTHTQIVVKCYYVRPDRSLDNQSFLREIASLITFDHPCIVPLIGYDTPSHGIGARVAMPYIGPDSLSSVLDDTSAHPWLTCTMKAIIIVGIVIGMHFVHCGNIIHRDLTPQNILLDSVTHWPKIGDFGTSRFDTLDYTMTKNCGTPFYMAPEMFKPGPYTKTVDVFAFGMILFEIVTGQKPYGKDISPWQWMEHIGKGGRADIPDTVAPFMKIVIEACWRDNADSRPTFHAIFSYLRQNKFKIFPVVDSDKVEEYLQRMM
jgi:serine/threonine protein kinase